MTSGPYSSQKEVSLTVMNTLYIPGELHAPLQLDDVGHDVLEGELGGLVQHGELGVEALQLGVLLLHDGGEVVDDVLLLVGRLGDGERVQRLQLEAVARALLLRVHVVAEGKDQLQNAFQLLRAPEISWNI